MVEAISSGGKTDNKDKKIIELAKKNRSLQLQVESLKTKAAKAAEFALKLRDEHSEASVTASPKKNMESTIMSTMGGSGGTQDLEKKLKE